MAHQDAPQGGLAGNHAVSEVAPDVGPGSGPESGPDGAAYVVDDRPRRKRMALPLSIGGVVLLATAYIKFVDPNQPGHYPVCPTRLLFGIDCPGCGGLRATHALANGDVAAAFDHNALFVIMVPFLLVGYAIWLRRAWTGRSSAPTPARARWQAWAPMAILIVSAVFMIVRNVVPFLGSGAG